MKNPADYHLYVQACKTLGCQPLSREDWLKPQDFADQWDTRIEAELTRLQGLKKLTISRLAKELEGIAYPKA